MQAKLADLKIKRIGATYALSFKVICGTSDTATAEEMLISLDKLSLAEIPRIVSTIKAQVEQVVRTNNEIRGFLDLLRGELAKHFLIE